jgi:aspartate-semialdehyde dehydrogenase
VGGEIPSRVSKMRIQETSLKNIIDTKIKIIFASIPSVEAGKIENYLRKEGRYVFSNASAHRMDKEVPILIPEVNPEHIILAKEQIKKYSGFIITNSNCTTSGLVMVLRPLMRFDIRNIIVNTFQAISGAGRRGLFALDILGNVIPFIQSEEEKIIRESKKILGKITQSKIDEPKMPIISNCSRVPVQNGHLENVVIEFKDNINTEDIKETFINFRGTSQVTKLPTAPKFPIILRNEENRPQPMLDNLAGSPERARGMAVSIGRLRKNACFLSLFLLVHNTIRGAAGTCILNAELAVQQKLINLK